MVNTRNVRTRIAPSPTGEDIHIGNLYTALINFAVAKKNSGKFIVRIEDTDQERLVKGSEEKILETLQAYGLKNDEGPNVGGPFAPYRQSERLDIYQKFAKELIEKGNAYYCFCTKERLTEVREKQVAEKKVPRYDKYCLEHVKNAEEQIANGEKFVVRLNVVSGKKISFTDLIRGEISFESGQVDDQVLLKSDGFPTYHLAVVIDDHVMEISHIIRAEEWISSTPKHILLYEAFGWDLPIFAHVPILRNPDKSKLSKRKNPVWASWYLRQEGFLAEAVLNYLALMGWSHPQEKEQFDLQEYISVFSLQDIQPVGPVFDVQKLTWLNGEWIRSLTAEAVKKRLTDFYSNDPAIVALLASDKADTLITLAQSRMKLLKDFKVLVESVFPETGYTAEEKVVATALLEVFHGMTNWHAEEILAVIKQFNMKHKTAMPQIYYLLTGKKQGLPLPEAMELFGKEHYISRLKNIV